MEACAQEVSTSCKVDADHTNDAEKSARGKRSFSDLEDGQEKQLATGETGSGPVVVEDSESHSNIKRAKVGTASDAPNLLGYNVPWSDYRYDVELVLPSNCRPTFIVRCHATQLALFPYFQAALKEEWRADENCRVYRLDMTSLKWGIHDWIAILECCYRRAPLKKRTGSAIEPLLLLKWKEVKRHFGSRYVELGPCLELLYFLNATTKELLWESSLRKKNAQYFTSFIKCFFLTSDPANPDDLKLFKQISQDCKDTFSASIVERAVKLANRTDASLAHKVFKWAFLCVALDETHKNYPDIVQDHLVSIRDKVGERISTETEPQYKLIDDFLYWTAMFMPTYYEEMTREYIAGNRDTCMRTFFRTHPSQRYYSRQFNSSGFFSAKFLLTYDLNSDNLEASFNDKDDDSSSEQVISLSKHFDIVARHPDAGAVRAMNYAGVLTSVMLQWRSQ